MADFYAWLEEGVQRGLSELLQDERIMGIVASRSREELVEAGQRAVALAVAPFLWDAKLGPMLDTTEVREELGVTRQAVDKAVDAGRLIALPAGNTRRFPIWQFNFSDTVGIRPEVAQLLAAFREVYPKIRPLQIASWAMTPQPELDDKTPSTWLDKAEDLDLLLDAARRTAWALAQ